MAFFGLTGLGSQSPFDLIKETPLHAFEPQDFQRAFMQTYRPGFSLYSESEQEVQAAHSAMKTAALTPAHMPEVLRCLYKCPKGIDNVPESARTVVEQLFEGSEAAEIGLVDFLKCMEEACRRSKAREAEDAQSSYLKDGVRTREFVSNGDFRGKLVKHQRMEKDPRAKALAPMTDSQTLGWTRPTVVTKRHPTKSCEETRYASAMIKAGVYYY